MFRTLSNSSPSASAVRRSSIPLGALLVAAGALATGAPAAALPAAGAAAVQEFNLDAFPRIDPEDLPDEHREWLEQVDVIITDDEREMFLHCQDDACRDRVIEAFWEYRDPTPGTPRNEYKELHYERLDYINLHFSRDSPRPAWMTDRGRMHLLLGEPMNTKTLPSTQLAYPIELWFYHADPALGIPPFFYLMFYKPYGSGEYRLYSPLVDGPMKLLNPAGEAEARRIQSNDAALGGSLGGAGDIDRVSTGGFGEVSAAFDVLREGVDAEVAQASLSFIPGDGTAAVGLPSMRTQMMIGDIENIPNVISPSAAYLVRALTGDVDAEVRFETLPMRGVAAAFLDPAGVPYIHWAVRTEGGKLNLNSYQDNFYMTFEIAGALTRDSEVVTGVRGPEADAKIMEAELQESEARELRSGDFIYIDRFPTVPGEFTLDLIMENNVSHEFGRAEFALEVPSAFPERIESSPPMLLWEFQNLEAWDPYADQFPFQIGSVGMLPAVEPRFRQDQPIMIFQQIYLPVGEVPASIDVVYRLEDDGGLIAEKTNVVSSETADRNGVINTIGAVEISEVPPGDYRLTVDVEQDDRDPITLPVTVVAPEAAAQVPFVQAERRPPATDPTVGYERAIQYRRLGETDRAIQVLRPVVEKAPEFRDAFELQTELLMEAGRYEEVIELLTPLSVERPNDAELLLSLAEASSGLSRHYDAIRYYERARLVRREDSTDLLNPLAAAYFAEGRPEKARELLQKSLELDPQQPEVRELLDRVLGGRQ